MLQLKFNPGLTLTDLRTTRPKILVIIINNMTLFSTDTCRQLEFRSGLSFQGKRLINHAIKTIESVFDFCGALCFMEPNCVSYNMELRSSAITYCELNNSTHFEYPIDLQSWQNYIYRGSKVSVLNMGS